VMGWTSSVSETIAAMWGATLTGTHDIGVLIHSHYELGVEATFWKDEPVEAEPAPAGPMALPSDFAEWLAWYEIRSNYRRPIATSTEDYAGSTLGSFRQSPLEDGLRHNTPRRYAKPHRAHRATRRSPHRFHRGIQGANH
jgi:hypothetical protein